MELLRLWTLLVCPVFILTTNVTITNAKKELNETANIKRGLKDTVDMREMLEEQVYSDMISSKSMIHYVFAVPEHLRK